MRGFTLIELLVVIALVAIVSGLAAPSLRATLANQKLRSAASNMHGSLLQARSEAMRLNRNAYVIPMTGTDWSSGWRVYVDINNDADFDDDTDLSVSVTDALPSEVVMDAATNTNSIGLTSRGFAINPVNGSIAFRSPVTNRVRLVIVAASGRSRLCEPEIVPGCEAPG